jgi:hypothetical protein
MSKMPKMPKMSKIMVSLCSIIFYYKNGRIP